MNRVKIILLLTVACAGNIFGAAGAGPVTAKNLTSHTDWNFVENKGQLGSSEIKYYARPNVSSGRGHSGGVYLYCKPGMISFVFTKVEKEPEQISEATSQSVSGVGVQNSEPLHRKLRQPVFDHLSQSDGSSKITTNRADLVLLNSNPSAQIIASDQQEYYENYYTENTGENGITNVHTYKTITYKSIYSNIDLVLHACAGGMEYEFVVYPGGKISDIQIQWNGFQNIKKNKDFGIQYSSALGNMTESAPYTYQGIAIPVRAGLAPAPPTNNPAQFHNVASEKGDRPGSPYSENARIEIPSQFILKNKTIGFSIAQYDKTKPLVIDPFLSWATYFGGDAFDAGNAVATDNSGNVYITGYAESQSGIATSGAFQTSFGGDNEDAFLAKFNSSGAIQWATYYGGDGEDYANGVVTDVSGDVYITGTTGSSSGIATSGGYKTSLNGADNAFLAKFNSSGARQWATYYGGGGSEYGTGIAVDASANVYMEGETNSKSGIATSGSYQANLVGYNDVFLAKFNTDGKIQWATYYGGPNFTYSTTTGVDEGGNIYITGYTNCSSGIASGGAHQTSFAGNEDVFLAKFDSSGSRQWATYYGGSGDDEGNGVATDKTGNVYLIGTTSSANGIATNNASQTSLAGNLDAFISKFSNTGVLQWATYYGGSENDLGFGIVVDRAGNLFISGTTESDSGIATKGSYQTYFAGGNDEAFLAQFSNNGALLWATYYGGADDDVGNGVASDGSGNVYITGSTASPSGIATSGAYQTSLAGGLNAFLAQFNFKADYDAGAAFYYGDSNVCAGKQPINVGLANYGNDPFDSVNINWSFNGKLQPVYHWKWAGPGKTGLPPENSSSAYLGNILFSVGKKDTIKAWTSRPNGQTDSIPGNDTSTIIVNVNPLPIANAGSPETICQFDTIKIGPPGVISPNISYSWSSKPAGTTSTLSEFPVSPNVTTSYYYTVANTKTGCSNSDTVIITVNPAPPATTGPAKTICFGDTIPIGATAASGFTYNWISAPAGFSSTLSNPDISPKSATSYTLKETNTATGCANSNSVQINVNPLPVANVGLPSYSICNGTHVKIGANAQSGITYLWSSAPLGFSSTLSNPVVDPGAYTQYYLTVTDTATGCVNKNFANVAVSILRAPLVDVGKNQAVCTGVSAQIGAIPVVGYTYSWTSNPTGFTSTSSEPTVSPLQTSSYSLTVMDVHGCTNFDSVTITVNPRPHPNAGTPQNVCSGTVVQLGESTDTGHRYLWTSDTKGFGSTISDPVDSPKVSTEYYLKETISATGCSDSDSVKITVVPRPNSAFDVKNINGFGYQFIVQKPNYPNRQYHWDFGDTVNALSDTTSGVKVSHTYSLNGTYIVVLTISLPGFCKEIDSYKVVIKESASFNIYPNPFGLQTNIQYVLLNPGHVKITMTDEIGRFIGTLVDQQLSPGEYITVYNAGSWRTRPAVYYIIFQLDDKVTVKQVIQIDSIYY